MARVTLILAGDTGNFEELKAAALAFFVSQPDLTDATITDGTLQFNPQTHVLLKPAVPEVFIPEVREPEAPEPKVKATAKPAKKRK